MIIFIKIPTQPSNSCYSARHINLFSIVSRNWNFCEITINILHHWTSVFLPRELRHNWSLPHKLLHNYKQPIIYSLLCFLFIDKVEPFTLFNSQTAG